MYDSFNTVANLFGSVSMIICSNQENNYLDKRFIFNIYSEAILRKGYKGSKTELEKMDYLWWYLLQFSIL